MPIHGLGKAAFLKKCRCLIPRLFWPKLEAENEARREDFYRRLCLLFIPWRNEDQLKEPFDYYEEKWNQYALNLANQSEDAYNDLDCIMYVLKYVFN